MSSCLTLQLVVIFGVEVTHLEVLVLALSVLHDRQQAVRKYKAVSSYQDL